MKAPLKKEKKTIDLLNYETIMSLKNFNSRKNNISFIRYLDFCVFVKSSNFRISGIVIDFPAHQLLLDCFCYWIVSVFRLSLLLDCLCCQIISVIRLSLLLDCFCYQIVYVIRLFMLLDCFCYQIVSFIRVFLLLDCLCYQIASVIRLCLLLDCLCY